MQVAPIVIARAKALHALIARARRKLQIVLIATAKPRAKIVLVAQTVRAKVQVVPARKDVHSLKVARHHVRKVAVTVPVAQRVKAAAAAVPEVVAELRPEPVQNMVLNTVRKPVAVPRAELVPEVAAVRSQEPVPERTAVPSPEAAAERTAVQRAEPVPEHTAVPRAEVAAERIAVRSREQALRPIPVSNTAAVPRPEA